MERIRVHGQRHCGSAPALWSYTPVQSNISLPPFQGTGSLASSSNYLHLHEKLTREPSSMKTGRQSATSITYQSGKNPWDKTTARFSVIKDKSGTEQLLEYDEKAGWRSPPNIRLLYYADGHLYDASGTKLGKFGTENQYVNQLSKDSTFLTAYGTFFPEGRSASESKCYFLNNNLEIDGKRSLIRLGPPPGTSAILTETNQSVSLGNGTCRHERGYERIWVKNTDTTDNHTPGTGTTTFAKFRQEKDGYHYSPDRRTRVKVTSGPMQVEVKLHGVTTGYTDEMGAAGSDLGWQRLNSLIERAGTPSKITLEAPATKGIAKFPSTPGEMAKLVKGTGMATGPKVSETPLPSKAPEAPTTKGIAKFPSTPGEMGKLVKGTGMATGPKVSETPMPSKAPEAPATKGIAKFPSTPGETAKLAKGIGQPKAKKAIDAPILPKAPEILELQRQMSELLANQKNLRQELNALKGQLSAAKAEFKPFLDARMAEKVREIGNDKGVTTSLNASVHEKGDATHSHAYYLSFNDPKKKEQYFHIYFRIKKTPGEQATIQYNYWQPKAKDSSSEPEFSKGLFKEENWQNVKSYKTNSFEINEKGKRKSTTIAHLASTTIESEKEVFAQYFFKAIPVFEKFQQAEVELNRPLPGK